MRVGGALCPDAQSVPISGAGLWALLLSLWELDALSLWELLDALPEEAVLCEELLDEDAVLCELLPDPVEAEELEELPEEPDELPDAAAATVTSSALLVTRLSL